MKYSQKYINKQPWLRSQHKWFDAIMTMIAIVIGVIGLITFLSL
jgi:hypothetical protein